MKLTYLLITVFAVIGMVTFSDASAEYVFSCKELQEMNGYQSSAMIVINEIVLGNIIDNGVYEPGDIVEYTFKLPTDGINHFLEFGDAQTLTVYSDVEYDINTTPKIKIIKIVKIIENDAVYDFVIKNVGNSTLYNATAIDGELGDINLPEKVITPGYLVAVSNMSAI